MIGIRVDANEKIASGHLMRCLAIAHYLRKINMEVLFITSDMGGVDLVKNHRFEYVYLDTCWNDLNQEVKKMSEIISQRSIGKLIVDSYQVTHYYLSSLEVMTKVIYIEDLNLHKYPVSMVINYNIYSTSFNYEELYKNTDVKLLLGCKFAPLREEFRDLKPVLRNAVSKVLISTGGTDPYNVAGEIVQKVINDNYFKKIEFHVINGHMNQNVEFLKKLAKDNSSIVLHKNIIKMSDLMQNCDIAITAGGSTLYELCACGVPAITFSFADNQLNGVKEFCKQEIMDYSGDVRQGLERCINEIIISLKKYVENYDIRALRSKKMKKIVDGKGVERIVNYIKIM